MGQKRGGGLVEITARTVTSKLATSEKKKTLNAAKEAASFSEKEVANETVGGHDPPELRSATSLLSKNMTKDHAPGHEGHCAQSSAIAVKVRKSEKKSAALYHVLNI